jgi:hypothetical protein
MMEVHIANYFDAMEAYHFTESYATRDISIRRTYK